MKFEVYCDEANPDVLTSANPRARHLMIGSLWLSEELRNEIKSRVGALRERHAAWGEIKWSKVSPNRRDFYVELIDLFFAYGDNLRFRCIAVDRAQLNLALHDNDGELGFYKFCYQLLHHWILDFNAHRIFCDAKADTWKPNLLPRTEKQNAAYKNPDKDPRGVWKTSDLSARNYYSAGTYPITCPSGRIIDGPPKGMYWRVSRDKFDELDRDNRIWWGKDGGGIPQIKRFLHEVKEGSVPQTMWFYQEVGHTQEGKKELLELADFDTSDDVFITPKPTRLIQRILQIATDKDSIVLDSFAGSGTTGHAVLKQNAEDGGTRRFIQVEMDPAKWLTELLRRDGFTLARANLQKFLIRNLLEARIRDLRKQAVRKAFQQTLFGGIWTTFWLSAE